MREEYKGILDAGFLLQIDDPRLVTHCMRPHPEESVEDCRKWAQLRVEALNHALRGLPRERIRYHTCYGINIGPRVHDMELKDVIDVILNIEAGAYSFEAANPRHEHEWAVWKDAKLPDGAILIPGVITHSTVLVEHPSLVAQRIVRFAQAVGRENVIAGTDCGFATFAGADEIHASIVWAKFEALVKGRRSPARHCGVGPSLHSSWPGLSRPSRLGRHCVPCRGARDKPGHDEKTLPRQRHDRALVLPAAHAAIREYPVVGDPLARLLEHLARVGLEHQPLAGTPAARVHAIVEPLRKLVLVVVRVKLRPHVDVALRAAQRVEKLAQVFRVRRAGDHRGDHEGVVDDLAEAELLREIVRPGEQRAGRQLALDQKLHAAEQHAVVEREVDLVGRHELLERLDGRIVAARLVADRDRHAREILRRLRIGESAGTKMPDGATEYTSA